MKQNSRFRKFLSMFMVLAMLMQYGLSVPAFAEDGADSEALQAAAAQEAKAAQEAEEKAAAERAAAEKAAAEKAAAEKAAAEQAAAEKAAAEQAAAEKAAAEQAAAEQQSSQNDTAASQQANEPEQKQEESQDQVETGQNDASSQEQLDLENARAPDETEETVTEEALAEEELTEEETDETEYPAASFSGSANGVSVSVSAPEGALPEGTRMVVRGVSDSAVMGAVQNAVNGEVSKVKAVDISFHYEGKEIEPKKAVSVHMRASGMSGGDQSVVHISDGGGASVVTGNVTNGNASFNSADFSYYVIVSTETDPATVEVISDVSAKGIEVTITGTTEQLPEGTELTVTDKSSPSAAELSAATGLNISEVQSVGMSLSNSKGKTIDISGGVTVKVEGASVSGMTFVSGNYDSSIGSGTSCSYNASSLGDVVFASESQEYEVRFIVQGEDGESVLQTFSKTGGETIGTLPEDPFRSGSRFNGWFMRDEEGNPTTPVDESTVVGSDITAYAEFTELHKYTAIIQYYYKAPLVEGEKIFDTNIIELETADFPKTVDSPASVAIGSDEDADYSSYYPEQASVEVRLEDFSDEMQHTYRVLYKPYTATYSFVYMLKDIDGEGYTEFDREDDIEGVLNSVVTAPAKTFDYAVWDSSESVKVETKEGTEIHAFYNRKQFTLSYDSKGGSYVAAQTGVYEEAVAVSSTVPEKTGYTFDGWYLDPEYEQRAGTTVNLKQDTTLYAKWKGAQAKYTIVYMKEKYNPDGASTWTFANSREGTGEVGTEVVATSAPALTNNINGYEKDDARNAESKVTIAADGSSVLTVYYSLIKYTLVFNISNNNGRITIGGQTYTGSNYRITGVVLGQDVSAMWPSTQSEIYDTRTGWNKEYFDGWTGAGTTYITKRYELIWDNVKKANQNHVMTFKATWSDDSHNRNAEYWLQQPDGTYVRADEYTQIGLNTNNLSAKDIDGYSKHNGTPSGYEGSGFTSSDEVIHHDAFDDTYQDDGGHRWDEPYSRMISRNGHVYYFDHSIAYREWNPFWGYVTRYYYVYTCHEDAYDEHVASDTYVYRFYYDRQKYTITYYDGSTKLRTTNPIMFGADISSYNYTPSKPAGKEDYSWEGWHSDSSLQNSFSFGTMPGNDVVVYAKWKAPSYEVKFDLNGEGASAGFALTQSVEKNHFASDPGTPVRENYKFTGWYSDAECTRHYDWNMPITANGTVIYAGWDMEPLSYTVHYVDEEGSEMYPDKVVENSAYVVGQTITENAVTITGYRPDKSSQAITLAIGVNEITFVYSEKTSEIDYVVHYVLENDTDVKVAPDKQETVSGDVSEVIEFAAAVDRSVYQGEDVYPTETAKLHRLTSSDNEIWFYYDIYKTARIHTKYVDMDGNQIAGSAETTDKIKANNATYKINLQTPNGYVVKKIVKDGTEELSSHQFKVKEAGTIEIEVYCQKTLTVVAKNKSKTYDGTALVSSGVQDADVKGLVPGHSVTSVSYEGSQTDAGTSLTTPANAVVSGPGHSDYYKITYIPGNLTVNPVSVVVNVEADNWDGPVYDGTSKKYGFRSYNDCISITNDVYKAAHGEEIWNMVKNISDTQTNAGTYNITEATIRSAITLPEDPNFTVTLNVRPGLLVIKPAELTVTTGSATKQYDGTALTKDQASVSGLVNGETAEVKATGSQTVVGSSKNTYSITWGTANANNYVITTENFGTLEVTTGSVVITVTGNKAELEYNGKPQNVTGYKLSSTSAGYDESKVVFTGSAVVEKTDAGTYPMGLKAADFSYSDTNVNATFNVTDGELKITPKAVKVTAEDKTRPYNTENPELTVKVEGTIESDTVAYSAPTTEAVKTSPTGTYDIVVNGTKNQGNYEVTFVNGTLTVTKSTDIDVVPEPGDEDEKMDAGSKNITVVYDGKPHTVRGKATVAGAKIEYSTDGSPWSESAPVRTDAGSVSFSIRASADNYETVVKSGYTLTVTPKDATVKTGSATKTYDGTALTNDQASIEGLVTGDTATVTANGSQTEVGSSENGYSIAWGTAKEGNYTITEELGTLTVTEAEEEEVIPTPPTPPTPDPEPTPTPEPEPAPAATPAAGGTPAVTPAAPAAPAAVIADDPVPEAEPEAEIEDAPAPLAPPAAPWALINLICAALSTVGAAIALFRRKEDDEEDDEEKDEDEDDNRGRNMTIAKVLGVLLAAASIITFILTEDMSGPMHLTDKWTILMAVLFAGQILTAAANKKASESEDEEEENAEA